MRFVWFVIALACSLSFVHAADSVEVKTNSVSLGTPGTLEFVTPTNWTVAQTNLNLPEKSPTFELRSADKKIAIRLYVVWEGFGGRSHRPTEAQMRESVRDVVIKQYLPFAAEKTFDLEKLSARHIAAVFTRLTDAHWTPLEKNSYHYTVVGMFECENIWGGLEIMCNDKDGPQFKAGMKVVESLRHKP